MGRGDAPVWSGRETILQGAAAPLEEFRHIREKLAMFPLLPGEAMSGAVEIVCYFFTVITAVVSYLLTMRF